MHTYNFKGVSVWVITAVTSLVLLFLGILGNDVCLSFVKGYIILTAGLNIAFAVLMFFYPSSAVTISSRPYRSVPNIYTVTNGLLWLVILCAANMVFYLVLDVIGLVAILWVFKTLDNMRLKACENGSYYEHEPDPMVQTLNI